MLVLAMDTATITSTVALLDGGQVLAEASELSHSHSQTLLPTIDRLLGELMIERRLLQAIAVGIGPGSFTGVRIGLALAKTLSFALQIPLVGISTLRALAENGRDRGADEIGAALDALKGEVFAARFVGRTDGNELVEREAAYDPSGWARNLSEGQGTRLLLGSGVLRYRPILEEVLGSRAIIPPEEGMHRVRAAAVGRLAVERLQRNKSDDPRTLEPLYCRLSEAELGQKKN